MRILWIEDFGEAPNPESYVLAIFKDLLGDTTLDKYWDSDEINLKRKPQALLQFCQQHSDRYEIILCRHYHDLEETLANYEVVQDIDVILIDINLSAGVNPNKPTPAGYQHKEGGFYIYNRLISQGFPDTHLCFLTGEKKSSLIPFEERCEQIFMPKPQSFEKTDSEYARLRAWLNNQQDADLILRRGILNVINEIETKNINLTKAFEQDIPVNRDTFLEGLKLMLSMHRKPSQHLYRILCDYLTKYFDRFSSRDLYKGRYKGNRLEIAIPKEYAIPAYFVRNWVAHNIITNANSEFFAQDVGFLFSIVIKAMFDYSSIERFKSLYNDQKITDNDLQTRLINLQNRHYSYSGQCEIFELIRLKGQKNWNRNIDNEDFVAQMYASFLFCCVELKSRTQARPFTEKAATSKGHGYWVNLTYLIDSKKDTFFESLKSIAYHRLNERNF